jgi:hypothetical protein
MMTRDELTKATAMIATLERDDALWATDEIIDMLIEMLRADPESPSLTRDQWRARFSELHQHVGIFLTDMIRGSADLDEIITAIAGNPTKQNQAEAPL